MPATPRAAALAVAAAAALALTASGSALASGFRVSNASVLEGTGATTTLRFTVTYEPSGSDPASANVAYQTADGSDVNPADYAFAGGGPFFKRPRPRARG